jgi:hypothetical protein
VLHPVDLGQLLSHLVDWSAVFGYMAVGLLAAAVEYVYGAALARSPVPEARSRGYAHMLEAAGGFASAGFFFAVTLAVAGAVSLGDAPAPSGALGVLAASMDRFSKWLIDLASLEKDLTLTVILSTLASTVNASAVLARLAVQALYAASAAFYFALSLLVEAGAGKLMVAAGAACLCAPRLRRLGPYLIFSALAAVAVSCAAARAIGDVASNLEFSYAPFQNPFDLARIGEAVTGAVLGKIVRDGYRAASALIAVSVGTAVAGAAAAAASAAAGGFAESIVNRLRL